MRIKLLILIFQAVCLDGNLAPKRDPNDGGKKTKIGFVVSTVGAGSAAIHSVIESTNPQQEQQTQKSTKQAEWNRKNSNKLKAGGKILLIFLSNDIFK